MIGRIILAVQQSRGRRRREGERNKWGLRKVPFYLQSPSHDCECLYLYISLQLVAVIELIAKVFKYIDFLEDNCN